MNTTNNARQSAETRKLIRNSLRKRHRAETRFRLYGMTAICFGMLALLTLFVVIIANGSNAFKATELRLNINFDLEMLEIENPANLEEVEDADYRSILRQALLRAFPDTTSRADRRRLYALIDPSAEFKLRDMLTADPSLLGKTRAVWLSAGGGAARLLATAKQQDELNEKQKQQRRWLAQLEKQGAVRTKFNSQFFTASDSRNAAQAGIWGALKGSFLTLLVTALLSFPIGVGAAIYLEEFAPKNKWTDFIEININNLAAVPSIIFGLLGLSIFLNLMDMPRASPLVGGLILTLMTLPVVIISSRAAITMVPQSLRDAALALGASPTQATLHQVVPAAMPGMLTGAIIGMAQALGETAPLLMIGMVAFIASEPTSFFDPATVLPVQIFLWADSPESGFIERTAGAIIVLMAFLITMNASAVILRSRLQERSRQEK